MAAEKEKAKTAVRDLLELYSYIIDQEKFSGTDAEFMKNVRSIDVDPSGGAIFELDVTPSYCNLNGVMHGGATALILDMCTNMCLSPISKPGYWDFMGGVSRTLNVSYLRALPVNTTIRIHGNVVQHGRTMALIQGRIESVDGNITYATCEHHKVHMPAAKKHVDMQREWKKFQDERRAGKVAKL